MNKESHTRQQGFTLLELLISISLLAFIVLIIAGGMRLGFRAAESGQKKIDALERYRTSLNIVEGQIQSAFMVKQTGLTLDENFSQFSGDRSSMQFRSVSSMLGEAKGPVLVSYTVKDDGTGTRALYGSEISLFIEGKAREIRLMDKARDISFEYFEKGPTDEKGKWVNEWDSKDKMPERVRMTIEKEGSVLALIIPLRTGAQAGRPAAVPLPVPR
jgi:general secretion pathway protein J